MVFTGQENEIIRPITSERRTIEPHQPPDDFEHQSPAVHRSNTAPATYGHNLPSVPGQTTVDPAATETVEFPKPDADPWVRTIHIHPDRHRPDATQLCRCLLDTGSDLNLISERILHLLQVPLLAHEGPPVTGFAGIPLVPMGSVMLTWHMDGFQHVRYCRKFSVISNDTLAPRFDVLLGNVWIKETNALLRNAEVMLARRLGLHRA